MYFNAYQEVNQIAFLYYVTQLYVRQLLPKHNTKQTSHANRTPLSRATNPIAHSHSSESEPTMAYPHYIHIISTCFDVIQNQNNIASTQPEHNTHAVSVFAKCIPDVQRRRRHLTASAILVENIQLRRIWGVPVNTGRVRQTRTMHTHTDKHTLYLPAEWLPSIRNPNP